MAAKDAAIVEVMPYGGDWVTLCAHLRTVGEIVDRFVIVEADLTMSGRPRQPDLAGRVAELPVPADRVQVITLGMSHRDDLERPRQREIFQRNAAFMAIAGLPLDTLVVILDVDEIIDPAKYRRLLDEIDEPTRLPMVPCYQYLDRRAPGWHCCERHVAFDLRRPAAASAEPTFALPGPVACRRRDLGLEAERSIAMRRRPGRRSPEVWAWHLSGLDPVMRSGNKERTNGHAMEGRAVDAAHMDRCARAGVHHRGWWYLHAVTPQQLEPLGRRLAEQIPGALAPRPLPSMRVRRAMRAWAELRLDEERSDRWVAWVDRRMERPNLFVSSVLAAWDRRLVRTPRAKSGVSKSEVCIDDHDDDDTADDVMRPAEGCVSAEQQRRA